MQRYPVPTDEQLKRLDKFARDNGPRWKSKLRHMWFTGGDENEPLLRQIRNQFGPIWLVDYKPKDGDE
jgi:hypothetical protein